MRFYQVVWKKIIIIGVLKETHFILDTFQFHCSHIFYRTFLPSIPLRSLHIWTIETTSTSIKDPPFKFFILEPSLFHPRTLLISSENHPYFIQGPSLFCQQTLLISSKSPPYFIREPSLFHQRTLLISSENPPYFIRDSASTIPIKKWRGLISPKRGSRRWITA